MTGNMKKSIYILLAMLAVACTQPAQPVQYEIPEVRFPMENTVVDAVVGEPVTFEAEVVSGDKVSCGWYVDETLEASSQTFTYTFAKPGSFEVRFVAQNGAGKVEKSYTAIVADKFSVMLSIGDSLEVNRLQLNSVNVAAIVESGADIDHAWIVDGDTVCRESYLGMQLMEARKYAVSYHGENAIGSLERSFTVNVLERPLEMSFSVYDQAISLKKNQPISITATAIYGGTGLKHSWTVDGTEVSTDATVTWSSPSTGLFMLKYTGVNAKGETASRSWAISVVSVGYILDDFEGITALQPWWTLNQNTPGITLADNPDKSGINTSAKCMMDNVAGTGGTSGYFDLKGSVLKEKNIDITKYNGIRLKVHLGRNAYYPRIQVGGTKYAPVNPPKFNNTWEELEFSFPNNFTEGATITFRPLLKQDGNNIASGAVTDTNTRTVYLDDIEFIN